ncbi:hypothetical protein [Ottowia thiooxydans]|uniref:hypothetical protein n=1 Tax=Ottowia thiooxydans TaxID=219182 RepID=UPI0012EC1060|nr:hypothetical protein [Ottowia thiooxydans]
MNNFLLLSDSERKNAFAGFFISDCSIRDRSTFSFLLAQDIEKSDEGLKRILNYFSMDSVGERLDWTEYYGFKGARLVSSKVPVNQAVMTSRECDVAVLGGGEDRMEDSIPQGKSGHDCVLWGCMNQKSIDGTIYAVGLWRTVAKRVEANKWQSLVGDRSTLPLPQNIGKNNDAGFDAIDGFNSTDIYCVGGKGDAWRYDGQRWYQCVVPTNMYFRSVCCAGDGYVYIGMQSGSVMRGREDAWEIIHRDEMTLAFKDMVWYDGKVWCTSDYGLWVIENGRLKEADVPVDVKACSGNLSVGDGVMLLAGMHGATVYDGREWQTIL